MKIGKSPATFSMLMRWLSAFMLILISPAAMAQATLSTSFTPNTVALGSSSTLTYTITNASGSPIRDLAFTNNLPAGIAIAGVPGAFTDCFGASVSASAGGSTVSLSNGGIPSGSTCIVSVNVTGTIVGVHTNPAVTLTSDSGSSMSLPVDLTVVGDRPVISAAFSPPSVPFGGRSTLTFTVDNSANAVAAGSLNFNTILPSGLLIADPANASTDCGASALPPTFTAVSGTDQITLFANGFLPTFPTVPAGGACTITVDVVPSTIGSLEVVSGELLVQGLTSGFAVAALNVTQPSELSVSKSFVNDPAVPGGSVDVEYTITNRNRRSTATNIAFTDDFDSALSGLVASVLPTDPCGTGSSLSGSSVLSLSGGTLAPGGSCTFTVTLSLPAGATGGSYVSTSSAVSADLGGSPTTGDAASDTLFVNTVPVITRSFLPASVGVGSNVIAEYTITNPGTTSTATDISFVENLALVLPEIEVATLPAAGFCGAGSTLTFIKNNPPPPSDAIVNLTMSGGSLAPGETCVFQVEFTIPGTADIGPLLFDSGPLTATIDGSSVTGGSATATLDIVGGLRISKTFNDTGLMPGGTATIDYHLQLVEEAPADATGITFTDDLDSVVTGLTGTGLPLNDVCGLGSSVSGTGVITVSGGTLSPGESCVISVPVQVPASAAFGTFTSTTSDVSASISGVPINVEGVSDTLEIQSVGFTHAFLGSPYVPGEVATIEYTFTNNDPVNPASGLIMTQNLSQVLSGLLATDLPKPDVCGVGSNFVGPSFLIFTGGNLDPGASCTFTASVQIPTTASAGNYTSTATAGLVASSTLFEVIEPLTIVKTFTDDPVLPGSTVNLEYTITNLDTTSSATNVSFMDDLDAVFPGLAATGLPQNDICGTGSSLSGTGVITLSGGTLDPGASCTFSVTVQVPVGVPLASLLPSTSSEISGTVEGISIQGNQASDTLEISSILFSKSFDGPSVAGGTPTLTYTIQNVSGTATVERLSFSDNLDDVISGLVATNLPLADVCGEGSSANGTSTVQLLGGSLAPGETCTFTVNLAVPVSAVPGAFLSSTDDLTTFGIAISPPATDTLVINPAPGFAKSFTPNPAITGAPVTLTFTIDNSGSTVDATSLDFVDSLPAGMVVATPANASTTCTGGTLTAVSGSGTISYTGGTIGAGLSCTLTVDVVSATDGSFTNTSGDLTSSLGNSGVASASVQINPQPGFAKSFAPDEVLVNGVTTLTFTIDNSASTVDATAIDFTDNLPAGVLVASVPNASTTCTGGTLTALAGFGTISYTGGTVAAGASCTVTVDVVGATEGVHMNTSGDLTSSLGNSGSASDTLTVNSLVDLVVTTSESVDPLIAGSGSLTYVVTVQNNGPSDATGLILSEVLSLPAGVSVDSVTPSAGSFADPVWTVGGLAATGSETLTIVLSADATAAAGTDVISSTATVTGVDQTIGNPSDDSSTISTSIAANVDIVVSATESADPVTAGSGAGNLTYVISASNAGPSQATGLTLTNVLVTPTGVTVDSISPSVGSFSGTTWTVGDLAPGAGGTLTVILTVDASTAAGPDVISASAAVASVGETLVNTGDDSASVATSVESPIDLVVNVAESIDPVVGGSGAGNLTYTVTVNNQGPAAASNLTLSNTLSLPGGVTVDSVTPSAGSFAASTWSVGGLASGSSATLTVVLTVDGSAPAGTDVISNAAAVVSADQLIINTGDDADTESTSIAQNVDLALNVSESADPFVICPDGAPSSHTVAVTNNGPGSATGVVIQVANVLPAGVTIADAIPGGSSTYTGGSWNVGNLASGASETLILEFAVADTVLGGVDTVSTTASVSAVAENDTDSGNDSASVATGLTTAASLTVHPITPKPLKVFGIFLHLVKLKNDNPFPVPAARLFAGDLPSNTIVLNAHGAAEIGDPAEIQEYRLSNSEIAPGAFKVVLFSYVRLGSQSPFTPTYTPSLLKEPEVAVDVFRASPYPFKEKKKKFFHPILVTNLGSEPIAGFRLFVGNLPGNVTLIGEDGTADYGMPPVELPFITAAIPLAPGEHKIITVRYQRTNNNQHFIPVYRTEILDPSELPIASQAAVSLSDDAEKQAPIGPSMSVFRQTGNLLEWDAVEGQDYQVEFSSDLDTWTRDPEVITAEASRVQWFDDGSKTSSAPQDSGKRYYRLVEVETSTEE